MKRKQWLFLSGKVEQGSSVVELLIATALLGVTLTAIALSIFTSLRLTAENRYREVARKQAEILFEVARRERAIVGFEQFYQQFNDGEYCFNTLPEAGAGFVGYTNQTCSDYQLVVPNLNIGFMRSARVSKLGDAIAIEVRVAWKVDQSDDHSITLTYQLKKYE